MSYLFSFIILLIIPTTFLQETPPKSTIGLGSSACTYYGSIDKKCNFTVLPVENLPTECSSFIFDGCVVDSNFTMTDNFGGDFPKYLEKLMTLGRPIFSFYSRPVDVWDPLLIGFKDNGSTKVKDEVKLITDYLNENKGISGLILEDINLYIQSESNDTSITDNTIKYVETIRSAFPCLAIGLNVIGTSFVDWCLGSTSCIIFDKIDQYVDFYVINLINFNACSEELICGTTPLTGSDEIYTLELLKIVLDTNIIPKDKVHFLYRGSPVYDDFDLCSTTYSGLCINPKVNNKWCADTQKSYADKGKFAKDNGAGFIIENIDLIDPICSCQCDYAFAPFYFLLDGYSNFTTRLICPLFDGNCPK